MGRGSGSGERDEAAGRAEADQQGSSGTRRGPFGGTVSSGSGLCKQAATRKDVKGKARGADLQAGRYASRAGAGRLGTAESRLNVLEGGRGRHLLWRISGNDVPKRSFRQFAIMKDVVGAFEPFQ